MPEMEPLTPNETAELLSGLTEAPVPEGMARRAVVRWIEETRRPRPRKPLAVVLGLPGLRPALALAAAAVLVAVVRSRMGEEIAPPPQTLTARRSAEQGGMPERPGPMAPPKVAEAKEAAATPRPKPSPSVGTGAPMRAARVAVVPPPGVQRQTAPPTEMAMSPAPAAALADRLASGDAAARDSDLAYLNGAALERGDAASEHADGDTRLLARITLAEDEIALADLAGKIGASTGVAIVLSDTLAREPLAVHCEDRPLREVMRQMARALDIRWEQSRQGGAVRYAAVRATDSDDERATDTMAMRSAPPGLGGAAPTMMRAGAAQASKAAAAERSRIPVPSNVIGSPARVRALRAEGAEPPDTLQTEGWIIVR